MSRAAILVAALTAAGCAPVAACVTYDQPDAATADSPSPLPTCAVLADCAPYLTPGPCGVLACDPLDLVGEPDVPGVPRGCYVRIAPKCETPENIGGPCSSDSDCPMLKCYATTCVSGLCSAPAEPKGTPCDVGAACDGAGLCVPAP